MHRFSLKSPAFTVFFALLTSLLVACAHQVPVEVAKSQNDPREYRYLQLDNGLKVMLVHAPETEMTAVALAVGVGSFHNPQQFPGLAHYLEHMLFLGTEDYPEPNALQKYLEENAGFANAYTSSDHTNYYFQTPNELLDSSLDRFSDYFKAPLFDREYSDKERTAVHNEWSMGKSQDPRIMFQLLGLTGNPEHPAARLSVGNRETLPGGEDSGLYEAMLDFYQRYYVAELMTLTLVSQRPLAEQEALVREHFAALPEEEAPSAEITQPGLPPSAWGKHIYYRPQKDLKQLILEFPIEDNSDQWRVKPNAYLSNILSSEEPGTLGHYLREQNLANSMGAGIQSDFFGRDGFVRIFVDATEQGMAQRDQVIAATLAYIEQVRQKGVKQRYYDEYRTLAQRTFNEQSPPQPMQQAVHISALMHELPPAYVNSANAYFEAFDPAAINAVLEQLRPERLRVWQVSQSEPVDTDIPYYDGRYAVADIEPETLARWQSMAQNIELNLPPANTLASGGDAEAIEHSVQSFTQLIAEPGLDVWFRHAEYHRDGKGYLHFVWNTDLGVENAKHFALGAIMNGLLGEQNMSLADRAGRAGIDIGFDRSESNMQNLTLHGPVGNHEELVNELMGDVAHLSFTDAEFERQRNRLQEWLSGEDTDAPMHQLYRWLDRRTQRFEWDVSAILEASKQITPEDLRAYYRQWRDQVTLRLYAYGHYRPEQVRAMARNAEQALGPDRHPGPLYITETETPEPDEHWNIERTVEHNDVGWMRAYVAPGSKMEPFARLLLLNMLINNPMYTQLRTEEQWGYVVNAGVTRLGEQPALVLLVQSSEKTLPAIQERVERFLTDYEATLSELDDAQLNPLRESLVAQLTQPPNDFAQEASRYRGDFYRNNTDFDTRERLVEALKMVTPEQIKRAFEQWVLGDHSGLITLQAKGTGFTEAGFADIDD
ncbi:insulinase family protein [Marinimicrobium agarilyticum]|uniref:insulinase family protein n=1 Tax=Marinimicrobium agarilyticum TaxID=306546 RepID=UPI000414F151|nr:insulinase family protein [Marinimicrobium agarilyticum]